MKDTPAPWIQRAKATNRFHIEKLKEDSKWRLKDTARALKRSIGSISEDLLIAYWLRTHEKDILKFDYCKEALEWIREKELEVQTEEI